MKFAILFVIFFTATYAAPPASPNDAQILRYENENIGIDGYRFAYETSDGVQREESAQLKNIGEENPALEVRGSFQYPAPDGRILTVNFIANENGYQPTGEHLP